MNFKENPVKAGRISKVHGVHGGLVVQTTHAVEEPDEWPDWCFVDLDGGLVPFSLDGSACFQKDREQLVLYIEGIHNPDLSKPLLQADLYLPERCLTFKQSGWSLPDLSEYRFIIPGQDGYGLFVEYVKIPANELISIDWMGKNLLIPANRDFLSEINDQQKIIVLDLPEGLLDLN